MYEIETQKKNKMDFSQKAIKKAVLRHTVEHPSVIYPASIGILGGIGAIALSANPFLLGMLAGGVLISLLSWFIQYGFRQDTLSNQYLRNMLNAIEKERKHKIVLLGRSLQECGSGDANSQFQRLQGKFSAFQSLLDKKLNPGEMSHNRFLGAAEQVFLGAIDNLQTVTHTLKSSAAIDPVYIRERINRLVDDGVTESEKREIDTLKSRLSLYEKQMSKVNDLLIRNEEAMTQLDITLDTLTEIHGTDKQASMDLESAMQELQRIANRARDL